MFVASFYQYHIDAGTFPPLQLEQCFAHAGCIGCNYDRCNMRIPGRQFRTPAPGSSNFALVEIADETRFNFTIKLLYAFGENNEQANDQCGTDYSCRQVEETMNQKTNQQGCHH